MKKHQTILLLLTSIIVTSCTVFPAITPSVDKESTDTSNTMPNSSTDSVESPSVTLPEPSVSAPSIDPEEPTTPVDPSVSVDTSIPSEPSEPSISVEIPTSDPYEGIDTLNEVKAFYDTYTRATSYEDAQYRTLHNLISGDHTSSEVFPDDSIDREMVGESHVRNSHISYTYRDDGSYESYKLFDLAGNYEYIFYGGGYTQLDEVAAYLLAFGETPPNIADDKYLDLNEIDNGLWWRYTRKNNSYYSGPSDYKYQYEPYLPGQYYDTKDYYEVDFGDWINYNTTDYGYTKGVYVNEDSNTFGPRGNLRFCYVENVYKRSDGSEVEDRYVFYTYNHYNDFVEFLNYSGGWGPVFGNETAGNDNNEYVPSKPPTPYVESVFQPLSVFN